MNYSNSTIDTLDDETLHMPVADPSYAGNIKQMIAIASLVASDYAAVQGFVLSMALLFVTPNLTIDLLYAVIDPRMRAAS